MVLALVLAAVAGALDAVGFLHLGGYFISFMSGNTTRMSAEVVGLQWSDAGRAFGLIGLFFAGAVVGAVVSRMGDGRVTVLATATGIVALSATAALVASDAAVPPVLGVAVAMGVMNATFLRDGEVSIGLTYMTGTLVKAAQQLGAALLGGPRWQWVRYLGMWAALAAGSLLGAWAYVAWSVAALWPVCAVMAAATAAAWRVRRSAQR
ncbi:YoaK family protein [Gordonia spumicola]|uniref:YoaK family protein n=1 Tax=Gordonia spumicola TaxID=589161 RepID=UPI001642BA32|nr:YoaK family protein [Gordonia spumicola]